MTNQGRRVKQHAPVLQDRGMLNPQLFIALEYPLLQYYDISRFTVHYPSPLYTPISYCHS